MTVHCQQPNLSDTVSLFNINEVSLVLNWSERQKLQWSWPAIHVM